MSVAIQDVAVAHGFEVFAVGDRLRVIHMDCGGFADALTATQAHLIQKQHECSGGTGIAAWAGFGS